jgi:hypothetical protein
MNINRKLQLVGGGGCLVLALWNATEGSVWLAAFMGACFMVNMVLGWSD